MAYPWILYNNILESGTLAPTGLASGFEVENIIDLRTYTRYKADGDGSTLEAITLDAGAGNTLTADCLAIAGHNLATAGIQVGIRRSSDGVTWNTVTAYEDVPTDGPYVKKFTSEANRFWRIAFNLTASGLPAEAGVIMLGQRVTFPQYSDSPLDYKNSETEASESVSKGGHLLGAVTRYSPYNFSLNFSDLLFSWVETNLDPWWQHAKQSKPFFVSINDDEFSDPRFCRVPDGFRYRKEFQFGGYLSQLQLQFEGVE